MTWFFIALVGPVLYAIVNHLDKFLISRYLKDGSTGALVIFSALFCVFALPIVLVIHPQVLSVEFTQATVLMLNGMLVILALLCYFYALGRDEASYVVPFHQTIPIFAFLLGYIVLGETVSHTQLLAALIVIIGATILSFEVTMQDIRFKKTVVTLMLLSSLLYAINGVVFKLVALTGGYWEALFWGLAGEVVIGIAFFVCIPSYSAQFIKLLKNNRAAVITLSSIGEVLYIIAEAAVAFALILAPVALVLLVNAFQPFFVITFGILLTLFLPKFSQESLHHMHLTQKISGVIFMMVGVYLLL